MVQVVHRWAVVVAVDSGLAELVLVMAEEGHTSMPYPCLEPVVQMFRTPPKLFAAFAADRSKEEGTDLSVWYCTRRLRHLQLTLHST